MALTRLRPKSSFVPAQKWIMDALRLVSPPSSAPVSIWSSLGITAEDLHQLLVDLKESREKLSRLSHDQAEDHGSSTRVEEEEVVAKWRDRFLGSMTASRPVKQRSPKTPPSLHLDTKRVGRPLGCWLADSSWIPISDPASQAPWLPLFPSSLTSFGFPIKLQCSLSQAISHTRAMQGLQMGLLQLHLEGSIAISLIPSSDGEADGDKGEVWGQRRIALCRLAHLFLVKGAWHKGLRAAEEVLIPVDKD